MKTIKRVAAMALGCCLCAGLAACGGGGTGGTTSGPVQKNNSLTVAVYDGDYDTQWLDNMLEEFSKEAGIRYTVRPNVDLLPSLSSDLEDSDIDLYISHGIPWQNLAAEGKLEPLDDLYESDVEGVPFSERVIDGGLEASMAGGHYYKVLWTQGTGGFIYNVNMFEENGWGIPTVYSNPENPTCDPDVGEVGLMELCQAIEDAQIPVSGGSSGQTVTPFIWPGIDQWLWDYIFYEWWGQLAGPEKIAGFLKYESAEVFNPDGDLGYKEFEKAYEYYYDLVALHPEWSAPGSDGIDKYTAQTRFANGWAAMMPNAHWIYNKFVTYAPEDFVVGMFLAPTLPDALEGYEQINFSVGFGDSIILSRQSENKKVAKDFLRYMARESTCIKFSEDVPGTALAFKYDLNECEFGDNRFAKDIAAILTTVPAINIYSSSSLAIRLGSETLNPWPQNTFYYKNSWQDPDTYTASYIVDNIYATLKILWPGWEMQ